MSLSPTLLEGCGKDQKPQFLQDLCRFYNIVRRHAGVLLACLAPLASME